MKLKRMTKTGRDNCRVNVGKNRKQNSEIKSEVIRSTETDRRRGG